MITVLAVGKKHEDWVEAGIERYQKRLQQPFNVEWILLPHSSHEGDNARREESEHLLSKVPKGAYVLLLDERGNQFTSVELSKEFERQFVSSRPVYIIIGGAYGVDNSIRERADIVWSLSKLVFPHQLVRLLLTEQIYRTEQIAGGGKYHHA